MTLETWLIGAIAALAGFTAWVVKTLIDVLQEDREAWRQVALKGTNAAERATETAEKIVDAANSKR